MTALAILLNLAGATMLLLYAVRMVRTGIERAMGPSFKRLLTNSNHNRIQIAGVGVVLAIILQSSAAASLLATGFAASGLITVAMGLSAVLGADFGASLVIQILSFELDWLIPVLLAIGGWLFVKTESRTPKQIGRILLGIAFILLALRMIGEATSPIRDSAILPAISSYLQTEYVSAFLLGAVLTFLMHSSVAAILMFVTFVSLGVLPMEVGVSMTLGANLGSAAITVWLARGMSIAARRIPMGNLVLRGVGAVLALYIINRFGVLAMIGHVEPGQALLYVHMAFNAILLVTMLPFVHLLIPPLEKLMPDPPEILNPDQFQPISALDEKQLGNPKQALANVRREVLRMSQIVEVMAQPIMELYKSGDVEKIKSIQALDEGVNAALTGIRRYVAALDHSKMSKPETRTARELTEYSINLETAGDIIAKRLLVLALDINQKRMKFSDKGWAELQHIHERTLSNMTLAFNVLLSEDIESARLLMEEKSEMAAMERKSRMKHLKRLRNGDEVSFASSDIHLETLRALKDFNSQICSVAYPILYRGGQLLETRLIETLDDERNTD